MAKKKKKIAKNFIKEVTDSEEIKEKSAEAAKKYRRTRIEKKTLHCEVSAQFYDMVACLSDDIGISLSDTIANAVITYYKFPREALTPEDNIRTERYSRAVANM